MALSEARKRANNKWTAANMTVIGCKVRKDKAAQFKDACRAAGTTPNKVFTAALDSFLEGKAFSADLSESLPPDTLTAAQKAADATGETPAAFIARAVSVQAERDKASLKMGINPADRV